MAVELNHVALSIGRGDGPAAAALLRALGLDVVDNGPSLVGDPWYTVSAAGGKLACFLVPVSDQQLDLEAAVRPVTAGPQFGAYAAERDRKPDSSTHLAFSSSDLEGLERAAAAVAQDPVLAERVRLTPVRPQQASPEREQRLDASPLFAGAQRVGYLQDMVQVFVGTDLLAAGPLAFGQTLEFNHTFPAA